MTRLPRILSWLLLLGGVLAWLLGPAPAQPRGTAEAAGDPAEEEPPPVEIWLDDAAGDSGAPARPVPEPPRTLEAEPSEPRPLESEPPEPERSEPEADEAEWAHTEWSESDPGDAPRADAPAPPDADAALDLVRRMLDLQARMGDE